MWVPFSFGGYSHWRNEEHEKEDSARTKQREEKERLTYQSGKERDTQRTMIQERLRGVQTETGDGLQEIVAAGKRTRPRRATEEKSS